jgi:hypothetical protein
LPLFLKNIYQTYLSKSIHIFVISLARKQDKIMYTAVNKETKKSYIVRFKVQLSRIIGKSTRTILRHDKDIYWETDEWTIYNACYVDIKSNHKGRQFN